METKTYKVRDPSGQLREIRGPAGASDAEIIAQAQKLFAGPKDYRALSKMEAVDPTDGMSGWDKFMAGAGKAVYDLGRGIAQITGRMSQEEVDEAKRLDASLMNTGAGMAGNIVGNIGLAVTPGLGMAGAGAALGKTGLKAAGKYVISSPATLGGLATQGGLGAAQAALQPTATGEDRVSNATLGFLGGALVPTIGMLGKGAKATVEPLYEAGRANILGRTMRSAAGDNADAVASRLANPSVLVKGSQPTAAEVANSGGIAALQRAAAAADPEAYATRAAQQNEARVSALQAISGTSGMRRAAENARETAAGPLYRAAFDAGVDPVAAQSLKPQIKNLMQRMPSGVLEKAKELARLNGVVLDKSGSVQGLHWAKVAVDDLLSSGKQTGIGTQTTRALIQFKGDLLTVLDDLSPAYGVARAKYQKLSAPINQMDIGQEIADKSVNKLTGILQPQSFARALSDDTAVSATGFNKATLANTMTQKQLDSLNAIKGDLARSVAARDLGRGAGSDTVQKLAMTNLMERTGIPVGVLNMPLLGRVGNWIYDTADDRMKAELARALLDPAMAARLMQGATPSLLLQAAGRGALSAGAPTAIGLTTGLLNAP